METPESINAWAESEFGRIPEKYYGRAIHRAMEELLEVYDETLLSVPFDSYDFDHMLYEIADVAIVLMRLMGHFKFNMDMSRMPQELIDAIDVKMNKNRGRRWESDGTGHGYHIKE